jgi:hypothetical protein
MTQPAVEGVADRLVELLKDFGQAREADSLGILLDEFRRAKTFEDVRVARHRLHRSTIGMGSLSDLLLRPSPGSASSKEEANAKLAQLTNELFRLTKPGITDLGDA